MLKRNLLLAMAGMVVGVVAALVVGRELGPSVPSRLRRGVYVSLDATAPVPAGLEKATFGSGCFWCTEAVFQELKGVHATVAGYSGGSVPRPTYRQVCSGATGHAEVIQMLFDPKVISYPELLEVFWQTHDPTTKDRQGNDVGTQYRSAIFYHNNEQKKLASEYRQKLTEAGVFPAPIVTEIVPLTEFYPAEDYHQAYFAENGEQPYCNLVVRPKLKKFEQIFRDKLKAPAQ